MPSPAVQQSHGVTVAFGTSGFSSEIVDVNPPGQSRDTIDTSHQGTTNYRTFIPVGLTDNGELSFGVHYNPDAAPPMTATAVAETITVTFPSGATLEFSGFMTGFEPSGTHLDKFTADVTVKVTGEISHTPPPSS